MHELAHLIAHLKQHRCAPAHMQIFTCHADAGSDAEVQSLFDDIEYQKGGSVLRMLWNYMSSSHYASSRLPADVQPRHDENVRPLGLLHMCSHTLPYHLVCSRIEK